MWQFITYCLLVLFSLQMRVVGKDISWVQNLALQSQACFPATLRLGSPTCKMNRWDDNSSYPTELLLGWYEIMCLTYLVQHILWVQSNTTKSELVPYLLFLPTTINKAFTVIWYIISCFQSLQAGWRQGQHSTLHCTPYSFWHSTCKQQDLICCVLYVQSSQPGKFTFTEKKNLSVPVQILT